MSNWCGRAARSSATITVRPVSGSCRYSGIVLFHLGHSGLSRRGGYVLALKTNSNDIQNSILMQEQIYCKRNQFVRFTLPLSSVSIGPYR